MNRYTMSGSAGGRNGCRFVVLDQFDKQGGKGMRRVSWHRTSKGARAEMKRLNRESAIDGSDEHDAAVKSGR